jgi:hypothetical protein
MFWEHTLGTAHHRVRRLRGESVRIVPQSLSLLTLQEPR